MKKLLLLVLLVATAISTKAACYALCVNHKVYIVETNAQDHIISYTYFPESGCPDVMSGRRIICSHSPIVPTTEGGSEYDHGTESFLNANFNPSAMSTPNDELRADLQKAVDEAHGTSYVQAGALDSEIADYLLSHQ